MISIIKPNPEHMRLKGDLDGLIKLAHDAKEMNLRIEAILALGRMRSPDSISDLISFLTDSDSQISNAASEAFENFGKEAIIPLLETYENREEVTIKKVHTVLVKMGIVTVPIILQMVRDCSDLAEERAAYTIFAIGEPCVSILIAALGSDNEKVVKFSESLLETMGRSILPDLIKSLSDVNDEVKARVAALLIVLGDEVVIDLLSSCGGDTEETRSLKFYIISEIGAPALDPLYQALRDPNPVTSSMALKIFLEFGESAIIPLINGLFDSDPDIKHISENALIKIGGPVVPNLIQEIPLHKEHERDIIFNLLVRMGEPATPDMVSALYSPSAEISKAMASVLPRTGAVAFPYLMNCIGVQKDTTPIKRVFREMGRVAFPLLEEESEKSTSDRCIFAIKMLKEIDPVRAIDPLVTALYHREEKVRNAAIDELKTAGDIAMPRLIGVLSSGNESAASLARDALISASDDAAPHLVDALTDPLSGDVNEISDIIRMIGRPMIPYLITILSPKKPGYEEAAKILKDMGAISIEPLLEALASASPDQAVAINNLLQDLYNEDPDIFISSLLGNSNLKEDVVWDLINTHPDDVIPFLATTLHEGDEEEAERAGDLLVRFGESAVPSLIEALNNENDENRNLNITTCLTKAGPIAIPELLLLLKNPEKAAYSVAALSSIGEPAIKPLLKLLKDDNPDTVKFAGLALTGIGKPAAEAILPILEKDDGMVPILTKILAGMGGIALPQLLDEFTDLHEEGKAGSQRGIALMNMIIEIALTGNDQMKYLYDIKDHEISRMITNMMVSRGDMIVEPVLKSVLLLKTPVPDILVDILRPVKAKAFELIEGIMQALSDNDQRKIPLIGLLGALGDSSNMPVLVNCMKSEDKRVKLAAVKELTRFGRDALEPLTEAMNDKDTDVRITAVEAMGSIGLPVLDLLLNALKDKDGRIRKAAITGIAKTGEPAQFMLVQALDDPDRNVRSDVVKLLAKMKWKPKYTTDRLSYLFASEDFDTLVRIGLPSEDILTRGLNDNDPEIVKASKAALVKIRTVSDEDSKENK